MLARTSKLHHKLGLTLETPLLVPSFSSKGFGFEKGESEIRWRFKVATEFLAEVMLVSAYDLAHGYLDPIKDAITDITFVDSGGYELTDTHDLSMVYRHPTQSPNDWTLDDLKSVLDAWQAHIPAVFVSFDRPDVRQPLEAQIEAARQLFKNYPNQMKTLLIKPETKDQNFVQVSNVIGIVEELGAFDILGFTEKELGSSILKRMVSIANIRFALDDAQVRVPIHVYGSLDPITSVLYFLSGAEIFDGLTWLRYGFLDGLACYYHNYGAKHPGVGIHKDDIFMQAKIIQDNLGYLEVLQQQMQKFLLTEEGDFSQFKHNAVLYRESYDLLCTKVPRLKQNRRPG